MTESLFRAGLPPTLPGRELTRAGWEAIWADLVALMGMAVERGRIDTVRDEHTPEAMGRPPRVDRHGGEVYVYRRPGQPCHVCGTPVAAAPGRPQLLLVPDLPAAPSLTATPGAGPSKGEWSGPHGAGRFPVEPPRTCAGPLRRSRDGSAGGSARPAARPAATASR